ncbi:G-protein coupled receptor Mth2 [Rhipicephalus sanguineus]|nr:G-protein coupled receptor Mth2 [Rhipicephalus sanguineus]
MPTWKDLDLPEINLRRLNHCAEPFHGCSEDLISYSTDANLVTCSCAHNCEAYGDCCWNVSFPSILGTQTSRASCVAVQVSLTKKIHVNMLTGCPTTWPNDYVRHACERPESFADTFYIIPATSSSGVTYRNGFCAWCNNDISNATFWSVALYGLDSGIHIVPPRTAESNPSPHLRPCNRNVTVNTCPENVPEAVALKCKTYYSPVQDARNPDTPVFKNVYCALCNAVNVSRLSCSPATYAAEVAEQDADASVLRRTLKPVIRTPVCYAHHNGRCYIRHYPEASIIREMSGAPRYVAASDVSTELHAPFGYMPKWQSRHGLEHFIAFICTNISILFLVLKILVFCAYKEARRSSSAYIMCLTVTLLVAQVLFLFTKCIRLAKCFCFAGAVLAHYFFLSTFLWTSVLSYDIWKSLTTIKVSSSSPNRLALYSLLAWALPLLVVSASLTVNQVAPESVLSPRYGDPICFIGSLCGLMLYFFLPMAALVLFCHVLYFKTVYYIRTTSSTAECTDNVRHPGCRDSQRNGQQQTNLALFLRLSFIMGAPWAVTLVGSFVHSLIIDSVVNALAGLQGVYLFFGFKDYRYIMLSLRRSGTKQAAIMSA